MRNNPQLKIVPVKHFIWDCLLKTLVSICLGNYGALTYELFLSCSVGTKMGSVLRATDRVEKMESTKQRTNGTQGRFWTLGLELLLSFAHLTKTAVRHTWMQVDGNRLPGLLMGSAGCEAHGTQFAGLYSVFRVKHSHVFTIGCDWSFASQGSIRLNLKSRFASQLDENVIFLPFC